MEDTSPTMPQDLTPHRLVSEALENGVKDRDWFLWLDVEGDTGPSDFSSLVRGTEDWLATLDPEADYADPPEWSWRGDGVDVTVRALPKKRHARGQDPLVGNPFPAFAYWS